MDEINEQGRALTERILTQKMKIATLAHFNNGVTIDRLGISEKRKNMLARVEHVYWKYLRNPYIDIHAYFYEIHKGIERDPGNAHHAAKEDERVFWFVVDNSKPHSRKDSEMKVRAATDRLIRIGMETDNVQALSKGASIRMELDRLNQPESEQADMSKVAFLQPVVTTVISDVDETKVDYSDEQSRSIMQEFGAYVDPKRQMIEEKVEVMEARRTPSPPSNDEEP